MKIPRFNWDRDNHRLQTKPTSTDCDMPFSEPDEKGDFTGMPISAEAFIEFLKAFIKTVGKDPHFDIKYVEFSKASLFRILSQPGCEYLRFYFAFVAPDKLSLLIEGLDKEQVSLQLDKLKTAVTNNFSFEDGEPFYEERGNGGNTDSVKSVFALLQTEDFKSKTDEEALLDVLHKINKGSQPNVQ